MRPASSRTAHWTWRQHGLSLVEVLVAVVVLALGLLGLAGLQASGMRVGQASIHRGQAAQLAYDIVERMRANAAHSADYQVQLGQVAAPANAIAALDLQDWQARLQSLPAGSASVSVNGSEVTVVIQWDDSRGAGVLRGSAADDAARIKLQTSQLQITTQLAN